MATATATRSHMATEIITGQAMATAPDITIRIIRATPSKFTIRPAIPMGIAGLTIAAGIDTYIAAAIADIIITTGKTSGNAISSGLSMIH